MMPLHIPTLLFAIAIAFAVSSVVMLVIWRINRQMDGVLQWFQATLANTVGFLVVSPFIGIEDVHRYTVFINNFLTVVAVLLTLEGALRFRGFYSAAHWRPVYVLLPLFLVLSWQFRASDTRHLFMDPVTALGLAATALVMVWRTQGRHELKVHSLAALFAGLLAVGIGVRWVAMLANRNDPGFDVDLARALVFVGVFLYVMGWTFSITVACYFRAYQKALQMAREDALTGLPNRRSIDETLRRTLLRARRYDDGFAVIVMDLNRFKEVNDDLGHQVGDALLAEVARRLRLFVRETDFAGRLGGDEFLVMVDDIGSRAIGVRTLERLRAAVNGSLELQGHQLTIDVSAGMAIWPVDGNSVDRLLSTADGHMYREKSISRALTGLDPGI